MVCLFDSLSLIAACAAFIQLESPPCRSELRRGPPSAEHYLPTSRRISRAVARTMRCYLVGRSNPNAALFRSVAYLSSRASFRMRNIMRPTVEASGPESGDFAAVFGFSIRLGLHRLPHGALRSGPVAMRPPGRFRDQKLVCLRCIIQVVFCVPAMLCSHGVLARQRAGNAGKIASWRACQRSSLPA